MDRKTEVLTYMGTRVSLEDTEGSTPAPEGAQSPVRLQWKDHDTSDPPPPALAHSRTICFLFHKMGFRGSV